MYVTLLVSNDSHLEPETGRHSALLDGKVHPNILLRVSLTFVEKMLPQER